MQDDKMRHATEMAQPYSEAAASARPAPNNGWVSLLLLSSCCSPTPTPHLLLRLAAACRLQPRSHARRRLPAGKLPVAVAAAVLGNVKVVLVSSIPAIHSGQRAEATGGKA